MITLSMSLFASPHVGSDFLSLTQCCCDSLFAVLISFLWWHTCTNGGKRIYLVTVLSIQIDPLASKPTTCIHAVCCLIFLVPNLWYLLAWLIKVRWDWSHLVARSNLPSVITPMLLQLTVSYKHTAAFIAHQISFTLHQLFFKSPCS